MKPNIVNCWRVLLIVILYWSASCESSYFSIVGPKTLRSGELYRCAVSTHSFGSSFRMNVSLSGFEENSLIPAELHEVVTLDSIDTEIIIFNTTSFKPGDYKLSARGLDNFKFYSEKPLRYAHKHLSVYIQTDKAVYKAGDLIRFRVFAIDSRSRPYEVKGKPVITISDSLSNKIQQFDNVTFVKGKYENELILSKSPNLGDWTIAVKAENENIIKIIEIQEYVLPTFMATISTAPNVPYADGSFPVTVGALYTFGKNVQGKAVVTFLQWGYIVLHTRTVNIESSGNAVIDVNIRNDLKINTNYYDQQITITVDFTDSLTSKSASASTVLTICQYRYKIEFIGSSTFKPNLPYIFDFVVKRFDGVPAAANTDIFIRTEFDYSSGSAVESFVLDNAGDIELETDLPPSASSIQIYATYQDASSVNYIYKISSTQDQFLTIHVLTPNPRLYSPVHVEVRCTEEVPFVIYHMISKGMLIRTDTIFFENRVASFSFIPKFAFSPKSDLIVYYIRSNGEVISEKTSVEFRNQLPNYVSLSLSETSCKPGENVTLSVSSTMHSTVSLLAIDQSVLQLKNGNDITKGDIFSNFDEYNFVENSGPVFNGPMFGRSPWWYETYEKKFGQANFLIMSNAIDIFPTYQTFPWFFDEMFPMAMPSQADPSGAEPSMMSQPSMMERPTMEDFSSPSLSSTTVLPPAEAPPPKKRKDFFETLAWQDVEILSSPKRAEPHKGVEKIHIKLPDSITIFIFSGVSMHKRFGLGLPDFLPSLKIFMPFFIELTLPFSVKRGELLKQDIYVYNYLLEPQVVTVTVDRNDAEFNVLQPETTSWQVNPTSYTQQMNVAANAIKKLPIFLKANKLEFVTFKVTAIGNLAGDAVEKKLRVIPEGVARYLTNSTFVIKNDKTTTLKTELTCTLPPSAVGDTITTSASVVGDIMGTTMSNLDKLIQMPYGCGEQNMLNFVPNIVILNYLTATNQLTDKIKTTAVSYTVAGYERELQYRRLDGSFSAFGNSDPSGSTWLTSFVVKSFMLARPFITIDMSIVESGLIYILTKQNTDGSFREDGRVIHTDMQGGSSLGLPLTAYVSIVLSECLGSYPQYVTARDSALNFLSNNYDPTDIYSLAVVSYALQMANHRDFNTVYYHFLDLSVESTSELHWEKVVDVDKNSWWYMQPRSLDVEITAYGLLTVRNINTNKALKIIKWLVKQRNSMGGFSSTQDTVVALEALGKFAALFSSTSSNMHLHMTPNAGSAFDASVSPVNALVLQSFELSSSTRQLLIEADVNSTGLAIVSLSCIFYEIIDEQFPRFKLSHKFINACRGYMTSQICISFIAKPGDLVSNMVLVRMSLPSGFVYDSELEHPIGVSKVETEKSGTVVVIYIDNLSAFSLCFNVNAIQTSLVENLKDGTIEVIDYYDSTKKASILYKVPVLGECQPLNQTTTISPSETTIDFVPLILD